MELLYKRFIPVEIEFGSSHSGLTSSQVILRQQVEIKTWFPEDYQGQRHAWFVVQTQRGSQRNGITNEDSYEDSITYLQHPSHLNNYYFLSFPSKILQISEAT